MNKRIVTIFGALVIVVSACTSSGASPAASSRRRCGEPAAAPPYISIVSKGFQHQFWQAVKKGAEDQATTEGASVNFMGPDTESNVDQQLNMLQTRAGQEAGGPVLCRARQQGGQRRCCSNSSRRRSRSSPLTPASTATSR